MHDVIDMSYMEEPSFEDRGLPCAVASLLIGFWQSDGGKVATWAENVITRIWWPYVWDQHYTMLACGSHPGIIATYCAHALLGFDYQQWERHKTYGRDFERSMRGLIRILEMHGPGGRYVPYDRFGYGVKPILPAGYDASRMQVLAQIMREIWLGRLHMQSGRFDADLSWTEAIKLMRTLGCQDVSNVDDLMRYEKTIAYELAMPFKPLTEDEWDAVSAYVAKQHEAQPPRLIR